MKLSRGSLVIVLIALAILLAGVIQVIARGFGDHQTSASGSTLPQSGRAITYTHGAS